MGPSMNQLAPLFVVLGLFSSVPLHVSSFHSTFSRPSRRILLKPIPHHHRHLHSFHLSSHQTHVQESILDNPHEFQPQVYPQRWTHLTYLSLLALLSDLICFSVSAAPSTFENVYTGHSAASVIDIFLYTNVLSCCLVSDIVQRFGLGTTIKAASALMTLGCFFRSGLSFLLPFMTHIPADERLVPYWSIVMGTVMVGLAQPFFQCTPPALSAIWFAADERATSTAVALNMNQIGIGIAFLIGGVMATSAQGLGQYFTYIALASTLTSIGVFFQFKDKPPTPPSVSEMEKLIKGEKEPPFILTLQKLIQTPAFARPLMAFICSLSITNLVGAFIEEELHRGGVTDQLSINFAGAGFELAILLGGIFVGGYVDQTKKYKWVTMACLISTLVLLIPLGFTNHAIGKEPILLVLALLGLGLSAGPIQPINAELAVDTTYPTDETAVESTQQIGGNLASALLVPVVEVASRHDFVLLDNIPFLESDVRGDVLLLMILSVLTAAFFSSFNSPLLRTIADTEDVIVEVDGKMVDIQHTVSNVPIKAFDTQEVKTENKIDLT